MVTIADAIKIIP